MKESYIEGFASHAGPELYAGDGNIAGVATTGVHAGQVLSSEMRLLVCRPCPDCGKATSSLVLWQAREGHGGVEDPEHAWKLQAREPGDPIGFQRRTAGRRWRWNDQKTPQVVQLI